jgi:hypothetical protein
MVQQIKNSIVQVWYATLCYISGDARTAYQWLQTAALEHQSSQTLDTKRITNLGVCNDIPGVLPLFPHIFVYCIDLYRDVRRSLELCECKIARLGKSVTAELMFG